MAILIGESVDFPSVMALYSLTKREAAARVDKATTGLHRTTAVLHTFGTGPAISQASYHEATRKEDEAKRILQEALLVYALVQDFDFRQQLTTLKQSWERFRMYAPGARDDQFLGNLMLGEGTEHGDALRAAWDSLCLSVKRVHATRSKPSSILV